MGFLNLARGALYMFAAYIGLQVYSWANSFRRSLVIAAVSMGVIGLTL